VLGLQYSVVKPYVSYILSAVFLLRVYFCFFVISSAFLFL